MLNRINMSSIQESGCPNTSRANNAATIAILLTDKIIAATRYDKITFIFKHLPLSDASVLNQ